MAENLQSNRPTRQRPIERLKGAASLPSSNSTAFMAAQKAAMKSIEESVTKIKAERERFFRDQRNSED